MSCIAVREMDWSGFHCGKADTYVITDMDRHMLNGGTVNMSCIAMCSTATGNKNVDHFFHITLCPLKCKIIWSHIPHQLISQHLKWKYGHFGGLTLIDIM